MMPKRTTTHHAAAPHSASCLGIGGATRAALSADLPPMPQESIRQHAGDHRFADRDGANADARVMAAFGDDFRLLARASDRAARRQDRGRRLDSEARDDRLAGRDAAKNAARVVGQKAWPPIIALAHFVGVLFAGEFGRCEAVADLDSLDGVDAHQRRGEFGVELAIDRRAPSCRNALGDNLDHGADRRARLAHFIEIVGETFSSRGVGREERVAAHFVPIPARPIDLQLADLHQSAANENARRHFAGDRARDDAGCGLTRRGAAAAPIIADAVLRLVRVISMAGTVLVLDVAIVLRALIDIVDEHADWRSGRHLTVRRFVEHDARENSGLVRLTALGGETRRSRPPPVQFSLNVNCFQGNARGTAVDDAPDSRPVTLAEGGDAKEMSESVMRHDEPHGSYGRTSTASNPWRRPIPATQYSLPIHLKGCMPSPANGQESNNMENVKMLKTLTAIGISAAIVFAPLAAIAQTDTTAPAAPAAGAPAAPRRRRPRRHRHGCRGEAREGEAQEAHGGQEGQEAGGRRRHARRSGRSAEELSRQADDKAKFADMSRPIPRMGRFFYARGPVAFAPPAPMANSRAVFARC